MIDRLEHIAGVLFGLAAGDRIGGPLNMALTLAESLVERGGFETDAVGRSYYEWWRTDGYDSGPTSAQVFMCIESGLSFESAAQRVHKIAGEMTAGCNPAHRAAPLAMCMNIDEGELAAAAIAEARLTHLHPLAGDVSAAVVRLCRALIHGQPWAEALRSASIDRLPETCRALKPDHRIVNHPSGFAPDVLAAAVRFVDRADCFESAIMESLANDSGANYVPVLVGSIGGARWGKSAVPCAILGLHFEKMPRLENLIRKLDEQ